ncbi:hypothetical protein WA158_000877 [Blastocystis sp. Blastoise]
MSMSDEDIFEDEEDTSLSNIRAMLQSYYGTDDPNAGVRPEDNTNLDSNIFDIKKYMPKVLREDSLPDIIQKNVKIVNEVKGLDTDMQKLVYENYSKFMSATKTIKTLQGNVGDMENQMQSLFTSMDKVDNYSSNIGSQLNTNRAKVEKLVSVQRLLRKLEFLFDLPSRLESCLKIEAYDQAIRYYTGATSVLKEYPNVISFTTIQSQADFIINKLKNQLVEQLQDKRIEQAKLEQYVRLLCQLNYPIEELVERYLSWHNAHLYKYIRRYLPVEEETDEDKEIKEISGESDIESDAMRDYQRSMADASLKNYIEDIGKSFVDSFINMVITFNDIFKNNEASHTSLLEVSQSLFIVFYDALEHKLYSMENYKNILNETINRESLFTDLCEGIDLLSDYVSKIQSILTDLNVKQQYERIIQKVIKIQIAGSYDVLRVQTFANLLSLNNTVSTYSLFTPPPPSLPTTTNNNTNNNNTTTTSPLPEMSMDNLFSTDFASFAPPLSPIPTNTTNNNTNTLTPPISPIPAGPSLTSTIFTTPISPLAPSLSNPTLTTPTVNSETTPEKQDIPTGEDSTTLPTENTTDIKDTIENNEENKETISEVITEKTLVELGEEYATKFETDICLVIQYLQPLLDLTNKILHEYITPYTQYFHTQTQQVFIWLFALIGGFNNRGNIIKLGNSDKLILGTSDITKKKNNKYIYLNDSLLPTLPSFDDVFISYRSCLVYHIYMKQLYKRSIKNIIKVLLDYTPADVEITADQLNRQIGYTCILSYATDCYNNMLKQYTILLGTEMGHSFLSSLDTIQQEIEEKQKETDNDNTITIETYISTVSLHIVQLLYTCFNDLLKIFTDINPLLSNPEFIPVGSSNRHRESSVGGMYNYIEQALSNKMRIYTYEIKYTMKEILNSIIRIMFKYLLETSRDMYFTKEQYIYLTNNLVFIYGMFHRVCPELEEYKGIYTDICNTFGDRCKDILSITTDNTKQIQLCELYMDKI